jgi:UDP-N-acetylglucosamine--N-acetylmuramyl-(pentapeptide) pyrophosphoryl-undecaprenol N-acetylglucosamine transferase
MGGYVSFVPVWLAKWFGISTAIHEQNALAGQVNRILSSRVDRVFTHFQQTLLSEVVVGNPVRDEVEKMDSPSVRFKNRTGPLKILVLGGSLGAKALNDLLPEVLARIDSSVRPEVRHQSGEAHMSELRANYERYGVNAKCESFIDDVLEAMQETDLLISRSGATTVAEVSAIGVAALFVPFPFAVDDHQTKNAQFLVEKEAAWMTQQSELTADKLVDFLSRLNRDVLLSKASKAYELGHRDATQKLCTELESLIK